MKHRTFRLGATATKGDAIARLVISQPLQIGEAGQAGDRTVLTLDGQQVGRITARHEAARALMAGDQVLHFTVNSIGLDGEPNLTVRLVTGLADEHFEMPPMREESYPVGLVGEQHHQDAIGRCPVGEIVFISHEHDNPHDDLALVAWVPTAGRLGYIPRDSFVRRAVFDEEKGLFATVKVIEAERKGFPQVVLDVRLHSDGNEAFRVQRRSYIEPDRKVAPAVAPPAPSPAALSPVVPAAAARGSFWTRLFGRMGQS